MYLIIFSFVQLDNDCKIWAFAPLRNKVDISPEQFCDLLRNMETQADTFGVDLFQLVIEAKQFE